MDVRPDDLPPTEAGTFEDEQRFGEWIGKRLEIYQTLEQQIQTAINQTVQFASELTRRMEDDTDRLLARYRQQRQEQHQPQPLEHGAGEVEAHGNQHITAIKSPEFGEKWLEAR